MDKIIQFDQQLLLAINGTYSPIADKIMLFFSSIPGWIPLYLAVAAFLFFPKKFGRNSFHKKALQKSSIPFWLLGIIGVLALFLCFGLCDQISVYFKNSLGRLRPDQEPAIAEYVRFIAKKSTLYGFPSGHATNAMGFAVLSSLFFRIKPYTITITIWAFLVGFSRVYLAKHYPLDVLCGFILGFIISLIIYYIWKFIIKTISRKYALHN